MSSGGGSKGRSSQSTQVDIPDFLQPFLNQSTGVAGGALNQLSQLSQQDQVADLNPDQIEALNRARGLANGEGGFIPATQDLFLNTALGQGLESFLNPEALASLTSFGSGLDFIPSLDSISNLAGSQLPDFLQSSVIPGSTTDTLTGAQGDILNPDAISALTGAAGGIGLPQESLDALQSTARGDFLFGGEGFDAAVDAAIRRAQPQILSTFGRAGAGGSTSGLAQTAIGQSAVDAFASQFGQERGRQLSAADRLAGLDLDRQRTSLDAAQSLAGLGLSENAQNINAAGLLGNLGLADAGLRGSQGLSRDNLNLNASGLLAGLASDERDRGLSSSSLLAGLSDAERNRQLSAGAALPDIGLLDSNLLSSIGGTLQDQEQREISGPLGAQLQLLMAALGGLPIESLLGQSSQGRQSGFSLGFGG